MSLPAKRAAARLSAYRDTRRAPARRRERQELIGHRRIWAPVSLLWFLMPIVILFSPLLLLARINPFMAVGWLALMLSALPGISVEIERPRGSFHIHLV